MMGTFKVDDVVMYGANGCCRIAAIESRGSDEYYILRPVHNDRTKLLVPLSNDELVGRMRAVPSKRSLQASIRKALRAETSWISDSTQRKEAAKRVLADGSEFDVLLLVRSFSEHKGKMLAAGKKVTSADSNILKSAQAYIHDEFSVVLGIAPEDVDGYIDKTASRL